MTTQAELFKQATHVHCEMCREYLTLPYPIAGEDDIDDLYDTLSGDCCDDQNFTAVIVSDTPLFPPDDPDAEANNDYHQPTTVGPFGPNAFPGKYVYDLDDDFFGLVGAEE